MIEMYDSYKSSDIEWLGDIPSHWEAEKVKFIFEENSIKNHGKEIMLAATQNKGVIPKDELEKKSVEAIVTDLNSFKLVQKGNFVISLRSFEGGIEYSKYQGIISPAYTVLKSKIDIEDGFFKYLFKSFKFIEALNIHKTGIREGQNISFKKFKDDYLTLPPKDEQESIANFLDKKCECVDKYILKQKELIELLKEKKSFLINKAVTKGLDSKVEYKESGIEWLGEIPKHWTFTKLKFVSFKIVDGTHFTPKYIDKGVPFLRVTDLGNKIIDLNKIRYISKEEHNFLTKRCNPEKGDLLISKNGTIGLTKVVDWDFEFSIFVSLCLIKLKKNILEPRFVEYEIQSNVFTQQLAEAGKTTSVTNLHLEMIKEMITLIPPKQEQKQIVEYIEKESSKIDKAISHIEDEIKLLQEYKQSLISSAVTGKIKVV